MPEISTSSLLLEHYGIIWRDMSISIPSTGPIPLVVAATGHTDLRPEDVATLESRVRQVFDQLRARYPHSKLEVLSPLAEGADRLVARVALACELRLIVPLPMEPDEYIKDFAGPDSIAEFDELRARAARSFVVRGAGGRVAPRPGCYEQVGAYSAMHCHVLLALWNGHNPHKIGGTSEIVRFRLEGVPAEYAGFGRRLDPVDTGVVHHIVTPRMSDPSTLGGAPFTLHLRGPKGRGSHEKAVRDFEQICESTEAFNALAAGGDAGAEARRAHSQGRLLSARKAKELDAGARTVRTLYGFADELAIRFQRHTIWTQRALFGIVFAAIVAFEVFAHELKGVPPSIPISLYVILLGAVYVLFKRAQRRELDRRYLDYRALAEGLRVQFYWRLARVPGSVADYYMRYRLQEVEWIRQALRGCELWTSPDDDAPAAVDALHTVATDWIEGQRAFFTHAAARIEAQLHVHKRRTRGLASFSVLAGVLTMLATLGMGDEGWIAWAGRNEFTYVGLIAIIGLTSASAALIHGYVEKRALAAHVKRYSHMAFLFQSASKALRIPLDSEDWPAAREVLQEIGRAALEENADWVMVHRERPLEVPQ